MQVSQRVHVSREAEEVWEIVGRRFGDVASWAGAVDVSRPISGTGPRGVPFTGRACSVAMPGFTEVVEELTAYDDEGRALTYVAAHGMPGFVREARSTWTVEESPGGSSVFTMSTDVALSPWGSLTGPALRLYLRHFGRRTCRDLQTFAETGRARIPRAGRGVPALRLPVAANAAFSGTCGLFLLTDIDVWARHLGGAPALLVLVVGLALLGYGLGLALLLARGVGATAGRVLAGLDAAWVTATAAMLVVAGSRLTTVGVATVAGTSLAVAALGGWQWTAARVPLAEPVELDEPPAVRLRWTSAAGATQPR